jgi:hypothetical protein
MIVKFIRAAAAAACIAASAGVLTLGSAPEAVAAEKVSKAVGAALNDALKSMQAKDWPTAVTKIKAAQALPDRTPYDDVNINLFLAEAAGSAGDLQTARVAAEAAADSPANAQLDPVNRKALYLLAFQLAGRNSEWQKTLSYGGVLETLGGLDFNGEADMAVAYYNLKDTANANKYAQKSIADAKAAGQQPNQAAMQLMVNAQAQSNPAAAEQMLEGVVLQSGSPGDWGRLIDHAFGTSGMNDVLAMDLYRLKYLTRSMKGDDAGLAGKLAIQLYYPGDAQTILQSAGIGGKDLATARAAAAKEQGSLNAEIAAAKRGSGQDAVKVGEALYGYGRFAEAEQLARLAMSKGLGKCKGRCDAAEAPILLGMALVGQGKYADAVTVFNGVNGSQAATKTAHLWSIYAQSKSRGAAPAAAGH